jgi:type II secretory pathway component PulF
MPVFAYKAFDAQRNNYVSAHVEAADFRHAKQKLREMGLVAQRITLVQDRRKSGGLMSLATAGLIRPKISLKEMHVFTQQMASILEAGLPLLEAIHMLEQQNRKGVLKNCLVEMRQDVMNGKMFSDALARSGFFDRLYIAMVRVGEHTGELHVSFHGLAHLMQRSLQLRNKVIGAMIYPAITIVIIFGVVMAMLLFVVPQFKEFFTNQGKELPWITLSLLVVSDVFQRLWWVVLSGTLGLIWWFNIYRKTIGKATVDAALLGLPVLGTLIKNVYTLRFISTLSTLLSGGIILTEAMHIASNTITNHEFQVAFNQAKETLMLGGNISKPLEQSRIMPLMVTKMMAVGEQSGEMDEMLNKAGKFVEEEVNLQMNTATEIIQPVLTVVVGVVLLYIVVAIYLPVFSMTKPG